MTDNCPQVANHYQYDSDNDGIGDQCDTDSKEATDTDGDGTLDKDDNCPKIANPDQADADKNGIGDACQDSDNDTVADAQDNCPFTPNSDQASCPAEKSKYGTACDADCDGVPTGEGYAIQDICPLNYDPDQKDEENMIHEKIPDGIGDACEDWDSDKDGVPDSKDNCVDDANPPDAVTGLQADNDKDGMGDICDPDDDNDLIDDIYDIAENGGDPFDPTKFPVDFDKDKIPNVVDEDADGDGKFFNVDDCDDLNADIAHGKDDPLDKEGTDTNCDGVDGNLTGHEGLLVATDGDDADTCGVLVQSPCRTIKKAVELISTNPDYKNVKYILLAAEGKYDEQGKLVIVDHTFTENVTLPFNVSLYGGYCPIKKGTFKSQYALEPDKSYTDFAYRLRDIEKCPTLVRNAAAEPIIKASGDASGDVKIDGIIFRMKISQPAIEATGVVTIQYNDILAPKTAIKAGNGQISIINNKKIAVNNSTALLSKEAKAIEVNNGEVTIISDNNEISVIGNTATAIKWDGNGEKKSRINIYRNKSLSVTGEDPTIVNLSNGGTAEINENNLLPIPKGVTKTAYAVKLSGVDTLKTKLNKLRVDNTAETPITEYNGYESKGGQKITISNDTIAVGNNIKPAKANAISITEPQSGASSPTAEIVSSKINASASKSFIGVNITGFDSTLSSNDIIFSGIGADPVSAQGFYIKGTGNLSSVTNNHVYFDEVSSAAGMMLYNGDFKVDENLIYINFGVDIGGVGFNGGTDKTISMNRNAIVMGEVQKNATAVVLVKASPQSKLVSNLLYGGRLPSDGNPDSKVIGLDLMDSSPVLFANTIIGGTTENTGGKVYALTDEGSTSKLQLKLTGNILAAMSRLDIDKSECYTYGIYLTKDGYLPESVIDYNYFQWHNQSVEKFNDGTYYGMCLTMKAPSTTNNPIEEQGVGKLNLSLDQGGFGFKGNENSLLGLEGNLPTFIFKMPKQMLDKVGVLNSELSGQLDLLGQPRQIGSAVDMGAIENGGTITVNEVNLLPNAASSFGNKGEQVLPNNKKYKIPIAPKPEQKKALPGQGLP